MNKHNRLNILLIEILIATLFFALASTVILKVYSAARQQSELGELRNIAQTDVQNISEMCYAAENVEQMLLDNGFVEIDGIRTLERDGYAITAEIGKEDYDAGELRIVTLKVIIAGETAITLPSARYIPEVTIE